MEIVSAWLIHHKASIDTYSPMNLDGSTFMIGIGVVPATNMEEALELFDQYLLKQQMQALELWKCEQYSPAHFIEPTQDNREINEVAEQAIETGEVFYACGVSSEALDCMEGEHNKRTKGSLTYSAS